MLQHCSHRNGQSILQIGFSLFWVDYVRCNSQPPRPGLQFKLWNPYVNLPTNSSVTSRFPYPNAAQKERLMMNLHPLGSLTGINVLLLVLIPLPALTSTQCRVTELNSLGHTHTFPRARKKEFLMFCTRFHAGVPKLSRRYVCTHLVFKNSAKCLFKNLNVSRQQKNWSWSLH